MSKGLFYYAQTSKTIALAEMFGDRLEALTASDKLTLIIILATWLNEDDISFRDAMLQSKTMVSGVVYECVTLLDADEPLSVESAESIMAALVEQIRDREFLSVN
jgi:hypothetical protein